MTLHFTLILQVNTHCIANYIPQVQSYLSNKQTICDWILENQPNCHIRPIFHFIGPANSYTHTLPIHSGITRFS